MHDLFPSWPILALTFGTGLFLIYRCYRYFWYEVSSSAVRTNPWRFSLMQFARGATALTVASVVLTVGIAIVYRLVDGKPSISSNFLNLAGAHLLWCIPSAFFYAAVVAFAKPNIHCRSFVVIVGSTMLGICLLAGGLPSNVIAGLVEVAFGVIPMSVLGNVQDLTLSIAGDDIAPDLYAFISLVPGLSTAAVILVCLTLIFFYSTRRVRQQLQ